jgi:hypothetical protein
MEIEILDKKNIESYNELALNYGSLFNKYDWLKLIENISIYGIYEGSHLIGGFHLYKENKFGLSIYKNPPFTPSIGPFLKIEAQNIVKITSKTREAFMVMAELLDKLNYDIISVSLSRKYIDALPFIWKKFKVVPGYTYIIDLNMPLDNIQKMMSPERRNDISKSLKDHLDVEKIYDFNLVKNLIIKTFSRQKKSLNYHYLNKILFNYANDKNSYAFATFYKDKPIAAIFCVFDKTTAYYLLGGYDYEYKHHGAGALAIWEAIKYSKEIGLKYFDFEGSIIPQIERYFRGFGGILTPYYRINKAKLLFEILLKFFKREIF